MAEENEIVTPPRPQREKQSISVPFLWEEKPGTPKKEWMVSKPTPWIVPPSPQRLIVSVPFLWEEKPGKPLPLPIFDPCSASLIPLLEPSPNPFLNESEYQVFHESLSALLEPSPDPFLNESEYQVFHESLSTDGSTYYEDWYSLSETDGPGSSSGSATQNASMDATALELLYPLPLPPPDPGVAFLFPLSPPSAGFLDKVRRQDRAIATANREELLKKSWKEECGLVMKRTLTLGDLIVLSGKLSCRRQPVCMKKKKFSQGFIKKSLLTCFA